MPDQHQSPWKRFWERGGWWRAVLLAAVYYGLYQLMSLLVGAVFGTSGGIRADAELRMDVLIDSPAHRPGRRWSWVAFALSLGWLKELFGRQPVPGRGWMWVAVGMVLIINVAGLLSIDYAERAARSWRRGWSPDSSSDSQRRC